MKNRDEILKEIKELEDKQNFKYNNMGYISPNLDRIIKRLYLELSDIDKEMRK